MTSPRRRSPQPPKKPNPVQAQAQEQNTSPQPEPTGKIFLGEEDKRLLQKFNEHIVNKLGLGGSRSIKL